MTVTGMNTGCQSSWHMNREIYRFIDTFATVSNVYPMKSTGSLNRNVCDDRYIGIYVEGKY